MDAHQNDVESVSAEPPDRSKAIKAKKPFPAFQLAILFLLKLTEPINSTVIYPFVNQQVRDTGVTRGDESATGYYAGIIASRVLFLFVAMAYFCTGVNLLLCGMYECLSLGTTVRSNWPTAGASPWSVWSDVGNDLFRSIQEVLDASHVKMRSRNFQWQCW
ncbi:hypothetical protein C0989_011006 [Termitomyces sp. Mn162]|nr:hypothetical protein C0989_011006 [Termitomyces sp. Mn162]